MRSKNAIQGLEEPKSTIPHLPDEVIAQIIPHLRVPLPRPTGKSDRSSIRQIDLATCMRVSSLFNNIAAPLLYENVVTDYLPSVAYAGFDEEDYERLRIKNKFQLLGYMKRLYLEYLSKDTPSYSNIMRHGGEHFILIEAKMSRLPRLNGIPTKMQSLATGAFLGGQRHIWYPVSCEGKPEGFGFPGRAADSREALSNLCTNPDLAYFCQHVEYGPLVFEQTPWPYDENKPRTKAGPTSLQHRAHFELDTGCVPVIMGGGESRWYCPYKSPDRDPGLERSIEKLTHWITGHMQDRESAFPKMVPEDARWLMKRNPSVHVDIYLPKSMTAPGVRAQVEQAVVLHTEKLKWLLSIPRARYKKDYWKIHSLEEAPACEGCGWTVDDLDPSERTVVIEPEPITDDVNSAEPLTASTLEDEVVEVATELIADAPSLAVADEEGAELEPEV